MKHLLFVLAFIIFFVLPFFGGIQNKENFFSGENITKKQFPVTNPSSSRLINKDDVKSSRFKTDGGKNSSWSGKSITNIKNEEYNISYNDDIKAYQSPNRANNIRFIYYKDGFTAKLRETKIPLFDLNDKRISEDKNYKSLMSWELKLMVNGYYRSSDLHENLVVFSGNEIIVDKNKAFVEDNNMRIDYTNDERGMRQDFIIKNRPDGNGKLKMKLSAETKLNIKIRNGEISFKDSEENEIMNYSSLKVSDANGKDLDAFFEKNNNLKQELMNSESFAIVVDDKDAVYPITIDPLSTTPNWSAEGNQDDAVFGFSVSTAGDINNDGFSDVIIGAPYYDNGQTNEGKVFVYYGSITGLLPVAAWTSEGNLDNAQLGWSVSTAGDVNNDGYDDVIIGANSYFANGSYVGRAYIYYGSLLGLSLVPNKTFQGDLANASFGYSVSTAGDVNNDGFSDVIVGSPLYSNGQATEGRSFVYYGSPTGPSTTANATMEINQASSYFGCSVSPAGDVNNDGYDDVIVGANTYDNPQRDQGSAFLFYGSAAGLSTTANWKTGSIFAWYAYNGVSVAAAGDVNGDGYDDVISGATGYDNGMITDEGKVFVYYGSATGLTTAANWTAEGNQPFARFGNSVACAGDVNNDGFDDVIVGAYTYDNGQTDEGRVFIYFGSAFGLTSPAYWTSEINQAGAYFGNSVSTAGDVNGDGFSDVIVGAPNYSSGQLNEGGAFVYYGASGAPKTLSLTMFIQGYYNQTSNNTITDTVSVYLRNSFSPFSVVDSSKAVISSAGAGIFSFMNALNGVNYYIMIKHRNSVITWSAAPQSFTNNIKTYNFTTSGSQAFGNNMISVDVSPVAFAIYNGDVNQDGKIELSDILNVFNDASTFVNGYTVTDLNGDNVTDLSDLVMTANNASYFVGAIHP